jgi:hypothetical protein
MNQIQDPNPNNILPREMIDFRLSYEFIEEVTQNYIRKIGQRPNA